MVKAPFGFETPEDSPGFLLWQTTITWQRLIKKALEPYQISHAQFVIMAILLWFEQHGYDTTQVLIVNWSKLDKMTVSQALKKLVTEGLVVRAEHKTDTRAKNVKLSSKGKVLVNKLVPKIEQIDEEFFGAVSQADQKSIIRILNKLTSSASPLVKET
jgi:DNA-binding MarR family transcriptional regulator